MHAQDRFFAVHAIPPWCPILAALEERPPQMQPLSNPPLIRAYSVRPLCKVAATRKTGSSSNQTIVRKQDSLGYKKPRK